METGMKAIWKDQVIAESEDIVTVEGNAYFPASSVRDGVLTPSSHTSGCPWKGTAHYHSLTVDGAVNENAVWYYPDPKPAAAEIKDRVAFWKGVKVTP
jgi:uncharacterized protein (DUF427 family)